MSKPVQCVASPEQASVKQVSYSQIVRASDSMVMLSSPICDKKEDVKSALVPSPEEDKENIPPKCHEEANKTDVQKSATAGELSAKQVRELRRLCRKTANRAEYEGRLVQLRQIASILATGGPSLCHFAPSYLAADSAMQAWLDRARAAGADWRDERPLDEPAIEELREWDRLLKSWAKRRFVTVDELAASAVPTAPPPTTPRNVKSVDFVSMSSPVSAAPSPATAAPLSSPFTAVKATPEARIIRRHSSRMSISRVGNVINVNIIRAPQPIPKPNTNANADKENVPDQKLHSVQNSWRRCNSVDKAIGRFPSRLSGDDSSSEMLDLLRKKRLDKDVAKNDLSHGKDSTSKPRDWTALRRTGHKSMSALKPRNW